MTASQGLHKKVAFTARNIQRGSGTHGSGEADAKATLFECQAKLLPEPIWQTKVGGESPPLVERETPKNRASLHAWIGARSGAQAKQSPRRSSPTEHQAAKLPSSQRAPSKPEGITGQLPGHEAVQTEHLNKNSLQFHQNRVQLEDCNVGIRLVKGTGIIESFSLFWFTPIV